MGINPQSPLESLDGWWFIYCLMIDILNIKKNKCQSITKCYCDYKTKINVKLVMEYMHLSLFSENRWKDMATFDRFE